MCHSKTKRVCAYDCDAELTAVRLRCDSVLQHFVTDEWCAMLACDVIIRYFFIFSFSLHHSEIDVNKVVYNIALTILILKGLLTFLKVAFPYEDAEVPLHSSASTVACSERLVLSSLAFINYV